VLTFRPELALRRSDAVIAGLLLLFSAATDNFDGLQIFDSTAIARSLCFQIALVATAVAAKLV
jgi:hypothetical protein